MDLPHTPQATIGDLFKTRLSLNNTFVSFDKPFATLESQTRIYTLCGAFTATLSVLLIRRIWSGVPFLSPRGYRSFQIFRESDFLYLHDESELPSKAPIESLEGGRWVLALLHLAGAVALCAVEAVAVTQRALNGQTCVEDALELGYFTILTGILCLRLYPTPHRAALFSTAGVLYAAVLIVTFERDVWPRLLIRSHKSLRSDERPLWAIFARMALLLFVELVALLTPRLWYPVDPYSEDKVSPEQTASWFNYIGTYSWIQPLIVTAWKGNIEEKDLPEVPDYDRANLWYHKYLKHQGSTAFRTVLALFRYDFLLMVLCSFLIGLLQFVVPISMKELLAYIEKSKTPTVTPWIWVVGLGVGPILTTIATQAYVFNATRLIIRTKGAFTQALLQKTLRLRLQHDDVDEKEVAVAKAQGKEKVSQEPKKSRVGMINNLMGSDLQQLTDAREVFMLLGAMPIEIVLSLFFLYGLLGWSSLVGVGLMMVTILLPVFLAKLLTNLQRKLRKSTDARVGLMSETLHAVRIIKYFGLEKPFLQRIREARRKELRLSALTALSSVCFHTFSGLLPVVNLIVTFAIYTMVMKQPLTASKAFTAISLFDILRGQFHWLSWVAQSVLYAFVSMERIDKFLREEEELDDHKASQGAPGFKNATLSWVAPGADGDNNFRLSEIDFECAPNGLTLVSGPVGSGKSSILLALLGEMRLLKGEVVCSREKGVAYAAQTPWLQCATVKENVLFGSEYDEERYKQVLAACGLDIDLKKLEAGDETEIGERGTTLSGGQKARLALARAIYSSAEVVLLDDILSALDTATARLVVEKCIKGEILRNRTVVLITHHVALCAQAAQKVVLLSDGKVVSECTPDNLPSDVVGRLDEVTLDVPAIEEHGIIEIDKASNGVANGPTNGATKVINSDAKKGKLVGEESYAKGSISVWTIIGYMGYLGGPLVILMLMTLSVGESLFGLLNQYFIGLWSDEYAQNPDINVALWLGLYAAVLVGNSIIGAFVWGVWYTFQWLAARRLHDKLIIAVLYSPIRFFDTTPIGRVINRLSNDIASVDRRVGPYLSYVLDQILEVIFRMFVMSGLIPAFLAPTLLASVLGVICGVLYSRAQIGVKRITSVKESPLISHFGDTITGILTIRAFSCQERFLNENLKRVDAFNRPSECFYNLNRWIGVRISWCTSLVGCAAGIIALASKGYTPGLIGFSMTNALAFSGSVLSGVRYYNALEMELNSFERVDEWINLPSEPKSAPEKEPPAAWPREGDVEVRDLSVKYSADGPEVLHKVSFSVNPGEKIGIVGRTGAGKSSLALSLLGFTEISKGSIKINGLDIKDVNLEALRRRVTIIPQDPVLFSGTIRTNLDPFEELDDTDLQAALEGCGLASSGSETSSEVESSGASTPTGTKKITLDTPIISGGENLSQGQRQLLAFARSIVRRSKLVILDEATSSTDMKTDERIRETLQTNPSFIGCSLITIAHRLKTVMGFDRILVLDNRGDGGEVIEYDTPAKLLENENGVLYNLAQKSGDFEELLALAQGSAR